MASGRSIVLIVTQSVENSWVIHRAGEGSPVLFEQPEKACQVLTAGVMVDRLGRRKRPALNQALIGKADNWTLPSFIIRVKSVRLVRKVSSPVRVWPGLT